LVASCTSENKDKRPSPPASDSVTLNNSFIKIAYSSPGVKEREIWNELVPYFKIWRTGANEATVFSTTRDLLIQNDTLPAGKYSLFTIPTDDEWTLIFNREWDQWGAYNYDSSRDEMRLTIQPQKINDFNERMTFEFVGSRLVFHWEYLTFSLEFSVL
jgi:hypothetical protein